MRIGYWNFDISLQLHLLHIPNSPVASGSKWELIVLFSQKEKCLRKLNRKWDLSLIVSFYTPLTPL